MSVMPIPTARQTFLQRLDLARFYKRRRVRLHMWGFGATVCFVLFAHDVYASGGRVDPESWELWSTLIFALQALNTWLKVRRDAQARTGSRIPMADASQFLTRAEFDAHVLQQDERHDTYRAMLDALGGQVRECTSEQRAASSRSMARFDAIAKTQDEIRKLLVEALIPRVGK